jgi:hypothetical protein
MDMAWELTRPSTRRRTLYGLDKVKDKPDEDAETAGAKSGGKLFFHHSLNE